VRTIGLSLAAIMMSGLAVGWPGMRQYLRARLIDEMDLLLSQLLLPALASDGCHRPLSDEPQPSLLSGR